MENVEILKTLSNEYRLSILKLLKEPKKHFCNPSRVDEEEVGVCVREFQNVLDLSQSTISHYLSMLEKDQLLTATRIGKCTYYKRNDDTLLELKKFISEEL
nr:winged helix-turn-helix transcriptional regulator [Lactococcus garvieae]